MIRFFFIGLAFLVLLNLYLGKLIDEWDQITPQQKKNLQSLAMGIALYLGRDFSFENGKR